MPVEEMHSVNCNAMAQEYGTKSHIHAADFLLHAMIIVGVIFTFKWIIKKLVAIGWQPATNKPSDNIAACTIRAVQETGSNINIDEAKYCAILWQPAMNKASDEGDCTTCTVAVQETRAHDEVNTT